MILHSTKKLIVLDGAIVTPEILLQGKEANTDALVLSAQQDPIEQITAALQGNPAYGEVHIFSHGAPGSLHLGGLTLDLSCLLGYQAQLRSWFAPEQEASLLLYGCQTAAGYVGRQLIRALHQITGVAIAASSAPVGSPAKGGSWHLDVRLGQPTVRPPFTTAALAAYPGLFNSAPRITDSSPAARAVDEDTDLTITDIVISDSDDDAQTVTIAVTEGTATLADTTGLTSFSGNGTSSITLSGSAADINAALNGLVYSPTQDFYGTAGISITTSDGINTVSLAVPISVTGIDDAPTVNPVAAALEEGGSMTFTAANFNLNDVDNDDVQEIIKITGLPARGKLLHQGAPVVVGSTFSYDQVEQLVYVHNGSQTVEPGGTQDSFTFIVDDGAGNTTADTEMPIDITAVNQLPAVQGGATVFEGEQAHAITLSIGDPDQTTPFSVEILTLPADGILRLNGVDVTVGQVIDQSDFANLTYSHDGNDENGGLPPDDSFDLRIFDDGGGTGTPASVDTTYAIEILPNNDDPILTANTGATVDAATGRQVTLTPAMLQAADPDSTNAQLTFTVTGLPTQGLVLKGGARLTPGTSFTQADLNAGRIAYLFSETAGPTGTTDSFTFTVRDAELRSWPSVREGGIYPNDTSNTLSPLAFNITIGPDAPDGPGLNGDEATYPPETPSAAPTGNTLGGPDLVNAGAQLNEGDTITIDNTQLQAQDADSTPDQVIYRLLELPAGGILLLNGTPLRIYDSFSQADIDGSLLTFEHAGGEVFDDSFGFTLSDGANVSSDNGDPFRFTLTATPINDTPGANVQGRPFLAEGSSIVIDNTWLTLTDVDGSGDIPDTPPTPNFAFDNTLTFQVTTLPAHGRLELNGAEVTAATVISETDLTNGNLVYIHDGNEEFADFFEVQVNDDTQTLGATNFLSQPRRVDIDIAKINDTPFEASVVDLVVAEGEQGTILGSVHNPGDAHLFYEDPDNSTIQRQYLITTAVAHGQLTRSGQVLGAGSVFTQQDLDNGLIQYEHDDSENFADSFDFEVRDGGGDVVPGSYNITVDPTVNDAPVVITPGTQNFATTTPLVFSSATGNAILIDDPDLEQVQAPGEIDFIRVTVDLQANGATYTASTLELPTTAGVTVTGNDGTPGGILVLEGALADVQAALDGLSVQVPNDEDRVLRLVVTADDRLDPNDPTQLNNGGRDPSDAAPGYNVVSRTINLRTSNVNDPPSVNGPATATVEEDGSLTFNGTDAGQIVIDDVDSFGQTLSVTVTVDPTTGTLSAPGATGNGSDTLTLTGSQADINAALEALTFTPADDFNGSVTLNVAVDDNGNLGTGGNQTADTSVTIEVQPRNDQPGLTVPGTQTIESSGAPLAFGAGAIAIDDATDLTYGAADPITVTLTATRESNGALFGSLDVTPQGGVAVGGSGSNTLTLTGTQADINATLDTLEYIPDNYNIDDTIRIDVVADDGNNGAEGNGSTGEATTISDSFQINVSGINEAPILTVPTSLAVNEDEVLILTGASAFSFDDPDDFGADTLEATVTVEHGTLALVANDGAAVTGAGTDTLVLTGTEAEINAALDGLQFTPDGDFHGSADLTVTINDNGNVGTGGAQSVSETVAIAINPVNDRPVAAGDITLADGTEDTTPPSAVLSTLVTSNGSYTDATDDQTASGGNTTVTPLSHVAIVGSTAYDPAQGSWQVSDGSGGWIDIPATGLSETAALVFPADREIRFVPAPDFHGDPGDLSVRLADSSVAVTPSTSGTNTLDLSANGGTSETGAWSVDAIVIGVDAIAPVNDAPTVADPATPAALVSIDEDSTNPPGNTAANLFTPKYGDATDDQTGVLGGNDTSTPLAGIAITANAADSTTEGTWQYNPGTGWVDVPTTGLGDSTALVIPATASLRFVPVANYAGDPGELTVRLSDGANFTPGTGVDISAEVGTPGGWSADTTGLATTVDPVNDAPVLTGTLGAAVQEGDVPQPIATGIGVVDIDAPVFPGGSLTVALDSYVSGDVVAIAPSGTGPGQIDITGSTVTYAGTPIGTVTGGSGSDLVVTFTAAATPAAVDALIEQLTYVNTGDDPTAAGTDPSRDLTITLSDGGNTGSGGPQTAQLTGTITIAPVDDAPVNSAPATESVDEDAVLTFSTASGNPIIVSDVDAGPQPVDVTLTATNGLLTLAATPTITATGDGTDTLTLTGPIADINAALEGLEFAPDANYNGPATIQVVTDDLGNTGSGGPLIDTDTIAITVESVNDVPVATDNTAAVTEDTDLTDSGDLLTDDDGSGLDRDVENSPLSVASIDGATDATQPLVGTYGSLTWNPDGSYTYTLDNANPVVQALNAGETLTETFDYVLTDSEDTDTATLTLTVNGTNDDPVVVTPIDPQTNSDADSVTLDAGATFNDPDTSGTLTFTATNLPLGLAIDPATGEITGTLDPSTSQGGPNGDGSYPVTVTATDDQGAEVTQTFTWTVDNPAPTATDNTAVVTEDTGLTDSGDLLTDDDGSGLDSDPDGDTLSIAEIDGATDATQPVIGTYGSLTWNPDGSYTYTLDNTNPAVQALNAGETLTETFDYVLTDSEGGTDTATLTLTVNGTNDDPAVIRPIQPQANSDADPVTLDAGATFNDPDTSGTLTFSVNNLPPGLAIDPATGEITGTLAPNASQGGPNSDGLYPVTVTATDDQGAEVTQTFTWTVDNPVPTATDNTAAVTEDTGLTNSGDLLTDDNGSGLDADPDGDTLSIAEIDGIADATQPLVGTYGSLTWNPDGSYTYTLDNANPVVQALNAGETLTETFDYVLTDGEGGTDTATLTLTVNGTNDAPVVVTPIQPQTNSDADPVTLDAGATFEDPDGTGVLTFSVSNLPPGLTIDPATGEITGTLDPSTSQGGPNGDGVYPVTVTATDDQGAEVTQTFTWTVDNPAPTATDNTAVVTEDTGLTDSGDLLTDDDSSGLDSDPDGDTLSIAEIDGATDATQPVVGTYGSLTWNPDGGYTYTLDNTDPAVQALNAGETLTETFDYVLTDSEGGTDTAVLMLTVNGTNDDPIVVNPIQPQASSDADPISLDAGATFEDPDGTGVLTFTATGLPPGLVIDPATGEITGILPPDASQGGPSGDGTYPVTVTATDDQGAEITQTFTWTVDNPAPTATDNTAVVTEDTGLTDSGDLLTDDDGSGLDSDPDGDTLSIAEIDGATDATQPVVGTYGSLTWNPDGSYTYTLDNANPAVQALGAGEILTETFGYLLSDGEGGTDTAVLTLTVNGTNDEPVVVAPIQPQTSSDADPIALDAGAAFTDPDASAVLTFGAVGLPLGLTIDPATGEITGTLDSSASQGGPNSDGAYPVTVTATDDQGAEVTQTFTWTVDNPAPTAIDNTAEVTEDLALTSGGNLVGDDDGSGADSDPDGDVLAVAEVAGVTNPTQPVVGLYGSLTWNPDGSYTYTLDNTSPTVQALGLGATLTETFDYVLTDGEGGTDTATLTLTVNGTNDAPVLDLDTSAPGEGYTALYDPRVGEVAIATPNPLITDVDDTQIESATITLLNRPDGPGEALIADGLPPGITAGTYDPLTGQLILSGSAPLEAYEDAIATLSYTNSAGVPNRQDRTIEIVINDGDDLSQPVTTVLRWDSDGDGLSDGDDLDDDNDGIRDQDEDPNLDGDGDPLTDPLDTDADGIPDHLDLDSDSDGIPDITEAGHGGSDLDQDGRVDGPAGSNGIPDAVETGPDSGTLNYPILDTDSDSIRDFQDLDSDDDGIPDVVEAGGDDANGDAILDDLADTNQDGLADSVDGSGSGTPLYLANDDFDNLPDYRDLDSDDDGVSDLQESGNPDAVDTDEDGRVDGPDADRDGIKDAVDGADGQYGSPGTPITPAIDSNGDGVADFRQPGTAAGSNGTSGNDIIVGVDSTTDNISGLSDPDAFLGYGGDDIINGGSDVDTLNGGSDNDTLNGGSGPDQIWGETGDDIINGGSGDDVIEGGAGRDILMGSGGSDLIFGDGDADIINGGRDNDHIFGGEDADTMIGGQGIDLFAYRSLSEGGDTIVDFEIVRDYIDLSSFTEAAVSFSQIQLQQVGLDTVVSLTAGGNTQALATLLDVNAVTLGSKHFVFDAAVAEQLLASDIASTGTYSPPAGTTSPTGSTGSTAAPAPTGLAPELRDDYIASHPDLIQALGYDLAAAAAHYQQFGQGESRTVDSFAEDIYLASNPDLIAAFGYDLEAATRHYIEHGHGEGRPTTFIPELYLSAYPDLQSAFGSDLAAATRHYVEYGYGEGRDPLAGFDAAAYLASHDDLMAAFGRDVAAARDHYLRHGYAEGRTITFEADDYLASYGDLMGAFGYDLAAATQHYLAFGQQEGRTRDQFDEATYLNNYADLQSAFGSDLQAATRHYVEFGYFEGRSAT